GGGGNVAALTLPLSFGKNAIEAVCFSAHGTQGTTALELSCSRQPEATGAAQTQPPADDGRAEIAGLGSVDLFGPVNVFVGAEAAGATTTALPTDPGALPRPRPASLTAGTKAVYRSATDEAVMTVEFSTEGASVSVTTGATVPAPVRLTFHGPLTLTRARAGGLEGSAPVGGGAAKLAVRYTFDETGCLAMTQWSPDDANTPLGFVWYRVQDAGSSVPLLQGTPSTAQPAAKTNE
ncbi:MAG: hypothetical protein HY303_20410, partial [Candidatus Wallbacteria bacterium]|nr:hypothetical protein [Candidatus Wallbacteria bacterium]